MSRWAREHPEEMADIAALPPSEQNEAMRAAIGDLPRECLDAGRSPCEGPVALRWPGHGVRSFPRCVKHHDERMDQAEADRQAYPDSPIAPEWFDPLAAGETWDEQE